MARTWPGPDLGQSILFCSGLRTPCTIYLSFTMSLGFKPAKSFTIIKLPSKVYYSTHPELKNGDGCIKFLQHPQNVVDSLLKFLQHIQNLVNLSSSSSTFRTLSTHRSSSSSTFRRLSTRHSSSSSTFRMLLNCQVPPEIFNIQLVYATP